MTVMTLLAIAGVMAALIFAVYRAFRKWGLAVPMLLAAAVSFLGASGVLAEYLWGSRWSWNLAHHGWGYAAAALAQGICFLVCGLNFKMSRKPEAL